MIRFLSKTWISHALQDLRFVHASPAMAYSEKGLTWRQPWPVYNRTVRNPNKSRAKSTEEGSRDHFPKWQESQRPCFQGRQHWLYSMRTFSSTFPITCASWNPDATQAIFNHETTRDEFRLTTKYSRIARAISCAPVVNSFDFAEDYRHKCAVCSRASKKYELHVWPIALRCATLRDPILGHRHTHMRSAALRPRRRRMKRGWGSKYLYFGHGNAISRVWWIQCSMNLTLVP